MCIFCFCNNSAVSIIFDVTVHSSKGNGAFKHDLWAPMSTDRFLCSSAVRYLPTDKKLFLPAANPRQGESLAGGLGDIRMAGIYPQSFGNTMNEGTILPAEHGVAVPCFLAAGGITGPADPQKGCRFPNYPLPGPYR